MSLFGFLLAFALFVSPDESNDQPHLFDQMQGQWEASGPFMGQDAHAFLSMGPMIEGQSYRLHIDIRQAEPNTDTVIFEGVGAYLPGEDDTANGFWTDSQANLYPLVSSLDGMTLVTLWGSSDEPYGRSTYTLTSDDSLNVVDEINTGDGWQTFADLTYARITAE